MVVVAQLVRASDCGSEGRRFETDLPPKSKSLSIFRKAFFVLGVFSNLLVKLNALGSIG